jgi:protein-L-isoaspartate(D-aspartate) O-methyltransferase
MKDNISGVFYHLVTIMSFLYPFGRRGKTVIGLEKIYREFLAIAGDKPRSIDEMNRTKTAIALVLLLAGCWQEEQQMEIEKDAFTAQRTRMVREQMVGRDIVDEKVLRVMGQVRRHLFVPERMGEYAYLDHPLPIGSEQTISQPYMVAYMTQALELENTDKVLEIGTGSGYQAAVLAKIVEQVFSIEIIPELAQRAAVLLQELGYENVQVRTGDGYLGWPEEAPFDAIIVTAAPDHVPSALVKQLAPGGRLVIPLGNKKQELVRLVRVGEEIREESLLPVRFVPMTGQAQETKGD